MVGSPEPLPEPVTGSPYAAGTILRIDQQVIAIYRRAVPDKGYHLLLVLYPNHGVKAQGIALEGHQVEELGCLPSVWMDRLQSEMRWDRDLIVFHCYCYEDVAKIPAIESSGEPRGEVRRAPSPEPEPSPLPVPEPRTVVEATPPTPPEKTNGHLRRGQRMQVRFGSNLWDAVYWGKDDQGQVIAHQTYEKWSLMHLDLERFASNLLVDPEVDPALIQEIETSLMNS